MDDRSDSIPFLIGINGFKGAGKDTIGKIFVEDHGFKRIAFADKLKDAVAALWGIPRHWVDDYKDPDAHSYVTLHGGEPDNLGSTTQRSMDWRDFLKRFGTEMGRDVFGNDFWVDQLLPMKEWPVAQADKRYHGNRCVTDCRFANEMGRIKSLGGHIIRVERPGLVSDGHRSEEVPESWMIDYTIHNDGTIDDLHSKVDHALVFLNNLQLA